MLTLYPFGYTISTWTATPIKNGGMKMLDLIKSEEQHGYCRDIYRDKNTNMLYCRHLNNRYAKGVYVNHWNTFTGEPDCPLKDGTHIKIDNNLFIIKRYEFTDWAIEKEII